MYNVDEIDTSLFFQRREKEKRQNNEKKNWQKVESPLLLELGYKRTVEFNEKEVTQYTLKSTEKFDSY